MHLLYTLCIFCDVLLIVIHVLLCVWRVGCWLHCAFAFFGDRYTVHPCLFADDGAFILASTLVPEIDLEAQSAWLRVFGGSTFLLDA